MLLFMVGLMAFNPWVKSWVSRNNLSNGAEKVTYNTTVQAETTNR